MAITQSKLQPGGWGLSLAGQWEHRKRWAKSLLTADQEPGATSPNMRTRFRKRGFLLELPTTAGPSCPPSNIHPPTLEIKSKKGVAAAPPESLGGSKGPRCPASRKRQANVGSFVPGDE